MPSNSVSKSNPSPANGLVNEFIFGLSAPFKALGLILSDPKLLTLSILPVLMTVGVLTAGIVAIMGGTSSLIYAKLGTHFGVVAQTLIALVLLFVSFQIMIFVIDLLSIPFNDWLALQTEKKLGLAPPERKGFGHYARIMRLDLGKTSLNLILMVMFTLGTWIPVVNLVSFLGIALLNTLNTISYPQSRRLLGVKESFSWLNKNKSRSLGFGIAISILFGIPVVNFFVLPLSIVGGTLIYFHPRARE